ncbi:MAG: CHAP domain-containing protein [Actinobacteria bacterium]|nr:CHAP domain-containing protein [Actinomycetota bacterium]
MYTANSAIQIANSQTGYHEGRSNGHWNNAQKYAVQLPGIADNQAWCDTFANWCLWQVGVSVPDGAISAGCAVSVAAYKKAGRWTEYPGIGFQVFYGPGGGTHTGIVTDYDDTYIYTVEGNTNTDGSAEGDGVYKKKRLRKVAYVYGYGIPYYSDNAKSADPKWNGKDLSK